MASVPPQPPVPTAPQAPAQKKKVSPFVWILAGCGGIMIAALLALLAGGVFVAHKVKQAGEHPEMAVAKIIAAANPDVEVVSSDESKGTITLRNKKTGEEITMNLADIKKGKIDFTNEKGESVSVSAQGKGGSGSFEVHSKEGSMTVGAGAGKDIPGWVPLYGGEKPQGSWSTRKGDEVSGTFSLSTTDDAAKVLDFYAAALERDGFTVKRNTMSSDGAVSGGILTGDADGGARSVSVTVSSDDGTTSVMVSYEVKSKASKGSD